MKFKRTKLENNNFKNTIYCIYDNCSNRINKRINGKLLQYEIFPDDASLICDVLNCKCGKNNPTLIPPRLLGNKEKQIGLKGVLDFKDDHEIFWGTDTEFEENLFHIFENLIRDLYTPKSEYYNTIHNILCDDIIYAKYSTALALKIKYHLPTIVNYFAIPDERITATSMEIYFKDAIKFLYQKETIAKDFRKKFLAFTKKCNNYGYLKRKLEKEFVIPEFIPLLLQYTPDKMSLGLRVKFLMENDFIKSIEQIDIHIDDHDISMESNINKHLINATSRYLYELEQIELFRKSYPL